MNLEVKPVLPLKRRHPLMNVYRRMQNLNSTMAKTLAQLGTVLGPRNLAINPFRVSDSSSKQLSTIIRQEVKFCSEDGEISQSALSQIIRLYKQVDRDLRHLDRELRDRRLADKLLKKANRDSNRLGEAIEDLVRAGKSHQVRLVKGHTDFPEEFVMIRKAMERLDNRAAQDLRGMDVDRWCLLPGVDLEDLKQIDSIAKAILASRVSDQSFELRVRSKAPGHPLLLMKRLHYRFATEEDLFKYAQEWGNPDKIFVTASKPSFRIVWVFDRERVGW